MKIIILIYYIILGATLSNCNIKNEKSSEIDYLRSFYEIYNQTWEEFDKENYKVFNQKIDSIAKSNCSEKLYNEFDRLFKLGHDLLTNDLGLENESLLITADSTEEGVFIISGKTSIEKIPGKAEEINNSFKVKLINQNEKFKIDQIFDNEVN